MRSTSRPKASHRPIGSRYDHTTHPAIHPVKGMDIARRRLCQCPRLISCPRCSIWLCGVSCTCGTIAGWAASLTPPRTIPRTSTSFRQTTSYPSPKVHVQLDTANRTCISATQSGRLRAHASCCASCVGSLMDCAVWLSVQVAGLAGSRTSGDYPPDSRLYIVCCVMLTRNCLSIVLPACEGRCARRATARRRPTCDTASSTPRRHKAPRTSDNASHAHPS